MRLIVCVLILVLSLTGCAVESGKPVPESKKEPSKITLTPVDLFEGDHAKFRPFLGVLSGAFKLRYEGNKPNANLDIDIWKNGKKVASSGSIGDLFFSWDDQASPEVEIMISIDTVSFFEGQDDIIKIKVNTMRDSEHSLVTFATAWDKGLTAQGLIEHNKARTFFAKEPVYLWGMHATSTNEIRTADFTPESLSRLEQAIIFTLRFED
ncbi:hypothetical protein [Paenibacillus sp. UMB4589-SE434]|uniref:hypothetical protein n=1 Tax=Paenibacillus sp. UMB4589-SE434 TaxID=3046314 RepID=UPI00254D1B58|nr:hypothetical protein [Paenibacillus sp. UMB4589-SE434]MDK8183270.1 hypothetical protein [Paenibacillus sp. UMB4589-SE434]